jgi:hypothetical protein
VPNVNNLTKVFSNAGNNTVFALIDHLQSRTSRKKIDTRDDILLDQQSDVVIVFWASCSLPIRARASRNGHGTPLL